MAQSPTHAGTGIEENPPIPVYDTSGPYTDPDAVIDLTRGLSGIRAGWIDARGDTEPLDAPSSEYGRRRQSDDKLEHLRFGHLHTPRRAASSPSCTTRAAVS